MGYEWTRVGWWWTDERAYGEQMAQGDGIGNVGPGANLETESAGKRRGRPLIRDVGLQEILWGSARNAAVGFVRSGAQHTVQPNCAGRNTEAHLLTSLRPANSAARVPANALGNRLVPWPLPAASSPTSCQQYPSTHMSLLRMFSRMILVADGEQPGSRAIVRTCLSQGPQSLPHAREACGPGNHPKYSFASQL